MEWAAHRVPAGASGACVCRAEAEEERASVAAPDCACATLVFIMAATRQRPGRTGSRWGQGWSQ